MEAGWRDPTALIGPDVVAQRLIPASRTEAFGKAIKQWCRLSACSGGLESLGD